MLLPAATADDTVIKNFLGVRNLREGVTCDFFNDDHGERYFDGGDSGRDLDGDPGERDLDYHNANQTTVTTIAPTPSGEAPILNNAPAPWNRRPAERAALRRLRAAADPSKDGRAKSSAVNSPRTAGIARTSRMGQQNSSGERPGSPFACRCESYSSAHDRCQSA